MSLLQRSLERCDGGVTGVVQQVNLVRIWRSNSSRLLLRQIKPNFKIKTAFVKHFLNFAIGHAVFMLTAFCTFDTIDKRRLGASLYRVHTMYTVYPDSIQ